MSGACDGDGDDDNNDNDGRGDDDDVVGYPETVVGVMISQSQPRQSKKCNG